MNKFAHVQTQNAPIATEKPFQPSAIPNRQTSRNLNSIRQMNGNQAFGRLVQAKLRISEPGDTHEQEADRVADQIVKMPDHSAGGSDLGVSSISGAGVQRACSQCEEEDEHLQ